MMGVTNDALLHDRHREGALILVQLFAVAVCSFAFVALTPGVAQAVTCDFPSGDGNWGVGAGPASSVTASVGNSAHATVRNNIDLHTFGGMHVESVYIWHDGNDFVEFGWSLERPDFFTHRYVFDARMFGGDYADRRDFEPSETDHAFRMFYSSSDGRYHFEYDGDTKGFARDPAWSEGRPYTNGEIHNQCDGGGAHFWLLKRRTSAGDWVDWSGTHRNCDTETAYDYAEDSNTEFHVAARSDNFTGGCDPLS
jgi:hypothetical protein